MMAAKHRFAKLLPGKQPPIPAEWEELLRRLDDLEGKVAPK